MPDTTTDGASVHEFPPTADALHRWIRRHLGVSLARSPLVPGHAAPFDYVAHAFFEAGALLDAPPADPPALDAVVWANRGGGKTYLGALATALDLVFKPGIEVRILGGSLEQSKRMLAHLRRFFAMPDLEPLLDGRITERRVRLRTGSVAEVLAASETSVRGTRVQKLRCDEVELFDPALWEAAQLVTRSATLTLADGRSALVRGSVECLSTMHRPYGLMHRVAAEGREGRRTLFRWGVVDVLEPCEQGRPCPTCALAPECDGKAKGEGHAGHVAIDDAIAMKGRVSLAAWESEMLCLRPHRADNVYPEFDPARHVVGEGLWRPPGGMLLAGMDFGFRAPTVILWAVLDPAGTLWVLAERVRAQTLLADHARALQEGPGVEGLSGPPAWVGADPAGNQRSDQTGLGAAEALRKAGLHVKTRRAGLGEGVDLVRARLDPALGAPGGGRPAPRLFIHARCAELIESLTRYHYDPDDPRSGAPAKDGPDHAADALRYLVHNLDAAYRTTFTTYLP